jgi:signal transduction histidine kinase
MIRVAIIGATGYAALELIKILVRHPEVEITTLTSRSKGSPHVASVHPQLAGRIDLQMADLGMTMKQPHPPSAEDVNRRLVEQYTEIAQLAGGLAHEIKNPLSTIGLNMELLAEDFAEPESPRDRRATAKIAVVRQECQRLQNLLDDFLNFAKVRTVRFEAADLNEHVRKAIEFFAPQATESNIETLMYLDPDLPSVVLDHESFRGALLNLVINAFQAMPDGGQLVVRTKTTASGVALELIDTGCGMADRTKAHIFDAFFSTKQGGSGLGLPTTRKIIQAHGGEIRLESDLTEGVDRRESELIQRHSLS